MDVSKSSDSLLEEENLLTPKTPVRISFRRFSIEVSVPYSKTKYVIMHQSAHVLTFTSNSLGIVGSNCKSKQKFQIFRDSFTVSRISAREMTIMCCNDELS